MKGHRNDEHSSLQWRMFIISSWQKYSINTLYDEEITCLPLATWPMNDNWVCVNVWLWLSGERQKTMQKVARRSFSVCGRGDGNNSIQCTSCLKLVHKKCSGIKGSMSKVMRLLESSNPYRLHKCRYWCQCKSGIGGWILLFRWPVECSCGDQNLNWIEYIQAVGTIAYQ